MTNIETKTRRTRSNSHDVRDVLTFRQHSGVTPANERLKLAGKHKVLSVNALRSRRYLDPKYSRWMSADPAVSDYMSQTEKGEGGIYNLANLNVYHYSNNNPIAYKDPDGKAAYAVRTGNKITISFPTLFKNATAEQIAKYKDAVETNLTGSFNINGEQCEITTNVVELKNDRQSKDLMRQNGWQEGNIVEFRDGEGISVTRNPSAEQTSISEIYSNGNEEGREGDGFFAHSAVHEALHQAGAGERYAKDEKTGKKVSLDPGSVMGVFEDHGGVRDSEMQEIYNKIERAGNLKTNDEAQ